MFNGFLPRSITDKGIDTGNDSIATLIVNVNSLGVGLMCRHMDIVSRYSRRPCRDVHGRSENVGSAALLVFTKLESAARQLAANCTQAFLQTIYYPVLYAYRKSDTS